MYLMIGSQLQPEKKKMAVAIEEISAKSYVGFDSITQQIEHKLLKRGFQFNVIVVGEFVEMRPQLTWGRRETNGNERKFHFAGQVKLVLENPP